MAHSPSRHRSGLRTWLWLLVAVVAVVGVFAWWQRPTSNGTIVKRRELQKLPEEHLFYPGATIVASGGHDYEWGIWGSNAAISSHALGVNATQEEVLAFYDGELAARGWRRTPEANITTSDIGGKAWRRDKLLINVIFLRKNDPQNIPAINEYVTGYRLTIIADRPTK